MASLNADETSAGRLPAADPQPGETPPTAAAGDSPPAAGDPQAAPDELAAAPSAGGPPAEPEADKPPPAGPYPGPRTFRYEERDRFYGREREARDLTALIVSERLVLFYSQSGAGKSSLINTMIAPGLANDNAFEVLPIGRVKGHSGFEVSADNIFIYNLLAALHQRGPEPPTLGSMSLSHFLDNLVCDGEKFYYDADYAWPSDATLKPRILIIDQFEEIFTTNTAFWRQREEFFFQLGEALRVDEHLWVLLAMREDFIASLDPYRHILPDGLRHRYYMQQLRREDALKAITNPVAELRRFEPDAAELLVDNLLTIPELNPGGRDQPPDTAPPDGPMGEAAAKSPRRQIKREAQFVEPVQLQAVCYQLWDKLKTRPGDTITRQDVIDFADVDKALTSFYEDTVADAVVETGIGEVALRNWFERELITEAGTRNMVFRGDEVTGSLPTTVADFIKSRLLVREIVRPAGIWYELIHDRFVQPVVDANRAWRGDQPLLQLAERWAADPDNTALLLPADQLAHYRATNWRILGPTVADFLDAGDELIAEQARAAQEVQRTARERRLQLIGILATAAVVILAMAAISTYLSARRATEQSRIAQTAEAEANSEADAASTARAVADAARATADAARATADADRATAEVAKQALDRQVRENEALRLADKAADFLSTINYQAALLLGIEAGDRAPTTQGQAILFRAADARLGATRNVPVADLRPDFDAPPNDEPPESLFTGPTGSSLATLRDGDVQWWPVDRPAAARLIDTGDTPLDLAAFATSHGLLAGARGAALHLWRSAGAEWLPPAPFVATDRLSDSSDDITALAFSPDGRRLAVARCETVAPDKSSHGRIDLWSLNLATARFEPGRAIVIEPCATDVAFLDRSGERLAWAGSDVVVETVAEGPSRKLSSALVASSFDPRLLAVAADQTWLAIISCPDDSPAVAAATGAVDCLGELDVWDLTEQEPIRLISPDAEHLPSDVTYIPARGEIALLRRDGTLAGWSADIADWRARACELAGRNLTAAEWDEAYPNAGYEAYEVSCRQYGGHTSILEELVRQCDAESLDAARARWDNDALLEAHAYAVGFDEWAGAILIDHLAGRPDDDRCRSQLRALRLPDETTAIAAVDRLRRVLALAAAGSWPFEGRAGDSVSFAFAPLGEGHATLRLLDGEGELLATNEGGRTLDALLPVDGPYRLEIEPEVGSGPLALSAVSTAPREIALGEAMVETNPAAGRWRLQGQAGSLLTAAVEAVAGDATLTLFDRQENQLAHNDDSGGSVNPRLEWLLPADGVYLLEVNWLSGPSEYTLSTQVLEPAPLTLGGSMHALPIDRRLWRFEGQAGDLVTAAVTAEQQGDASLEIRDEGGRILFANDDGPDGARDPELTEFLPADGVYYLFITWSASAPGERYTLVTDRVEAAVLPLDGVAQSAAADQSAWRFDGQVGDYVIISLTAPEGEAALSLYGGSEEALAVAAGPNPQLRALLPETRPYFLRVEQSDPLDDFSLSAVLVPPQPIAYGEQIDGIDGDRPVWRFAGRRGDVVAAAVRGALTGARLRLLDADYGVLATGTETELSGLIVEALLPDDGDYFLEVVPVPDDPGGYSLSLDDAAAETVPAGTVVQGSLERRLWRYDGREGTTVTFGVDALDALRDPTLTLYDSQGNELAYNDDANGRNPEITLELPADDLYTIRVGWYNDGPPGAYELRIVEE